MSTGHIQVMQTRAHLYKKTKGMLAIIKPPSNARVTIVNYQYMPPRDKSGGARRKNTKKRISEDL